MPEDSTRGYHLVNAGIRYKNRIGKADYTLSLDGNNLLNQKIYIHNSYLPYVPQMGCNFHLCRKCEVLNPARRQPESTKNAFRLLFWGRCFGCHRTDCRIRQPRPNGRQAA